MRELRSLSGTAVIAASLLLVACSHQYPEYYQPVPPPMHGPAPGSRADFIALAGSDTVYFSTDSAALDWETRGVLDAQARWLIENPQVPAVIEGYCDERGTGEYNLALGDRRANAARDYLIARGVDPDRLRTVSYGNERRAANGADPASLARNRRAVTIVPY